MVLSVRKDVVDTLYWAKGEWEKYYKGRSIQREIGIHTINLKALSSPRNRGKALFILGSGSSINKITEKQWGEISENHSMGLNFWLLNEFIPNYWLFELPSDPYRKEYMLRNYLEKKDAYAKVTKIIKSLSSVPPGNFSSVLADSEGIFAIRDIGLPCNSISQMRVALSILFWPAMAARSTLPYGRGTLSLALMMGMRLGYRKIVLLGIDLNNTEYFWFGKGQHRAFDSGQVGRIHKTINTDFFAVTIIDILLAMRHHAHKIGVEVSIGSQDSALAGEFQYYWDRSYP